MNICENCGLVRTGNPSGFCDKCEALLDSQAEESLQNEEAAPQQVTDDDEVEESQAEAEKPSEDSANKPSPTSQAGLKEAALGGVAKAAVGSENVEKVRETKQRAEKAIATAHATVERTRWAAQTAISALGNPAFWIAILVVIVLFIVSNVAVTTNQTVGSMKDDSEGASDGMASGVLARLAQRGTLLAQEGYKFSNVDLFVAAHNGAPRTNGNNWNQACPDIVNMIYGMPELYIGNNGIVNAYQNYKRLVAGGLTAQSWWFPETSSPGATQTQPPAGAIVQATGSGPAGHTYVVLTDDGKVIDNTWTIRDGGPVAGPGYRILDDRSRAGIRGWFLPPAEGYEGTFLNEDPMLPAVPEWAQGSAEDAAGSGGSGGPATVPAGSAQTIAKEMVTARGWDDGQFTCLVKLWTRESSWNVSAENSSSGAYGIPQALPGTKMASAGADWRTNPATQIKWGLDYISGRYSNPCGAWAHSEAKNWY